MSLILATSRMSTATAIATTTARLLLLAFAPILLLVLMVSVHRSEKSIIKGDVVLPAMVNDKTDTA